MSRTFFYLLCAAAALFFAACGEEKDSNTSACESSNVLVTGKIGHRAIPCLQVDTLCPPCAVMAVVNDTAVFVLQKNGQMYGCSELLESYSEGDAISICGHFFKGEGYHGEAFYFLEVSTILN